MAKQADPYLVPVFLDEYGNNEGGLLIGFFDTGKDVYMEYLNRTAVRVAGSRNDILIRQITINLDCGPTSVGYLTGPPSASRRPETIHTLTLHFSKAPTYGATEEDPHEVLVVHVRDDPEDTYYLRSMRCFVPLPDWLARSIASAREYTPRRPKPRKKTSAGPRKLNLE